VDIDDKQPPTLAADTDVLRSGVRQTRYRLKKKFFNGVPTDQIRTTPITSMSDAQWMELVNKWTDGKNMVCCGMISVSSHCKPVH